MKRAEDRVEDAMFFVHSNGRIEIGVHPVMFGFRIRAGFVGAMWCDIDYCCGANQEDVEEVYSRVLYLIKEGTDFVRFPTFKIKPIFNDRECIESLREMSKDAEMLTLPNVQIFKSLSHKEMLAMIGH